MDHEWAKQEARKSERKNISVKMEIKENESQ